MSQLNVFQRSPLQSYFKIDLATISNRNTRISLKILRRASGDSTSLVKEKFMSKKEILLDISSIF